MISTNHNQFVTPSSKMNNRWTTANNNKQQTRGEILEPLCPFHVNVINVWSLTFFPTLISYWVSIKFLSTFYLSIQKLGRISSTLSRKMDTLKILLNWILFHLSALGIDLVFLNFFENTKKVKPTQISTTLKRVTKIFQIWQYLTFICPSIARRKGQPHKMKIF